MHMNKSKNSLANVEAEEYLFMNILSLKHPQMKTGTGMGMGVAKRMVTIGWERI